MKLTIRQAYNEVSNSNVQRLISNHYNVDSNCYRSRVRYFTNDMLQWLNVMHAVLQYPLEFAVKTATSAMLSTHCTDRTTDDLLRTVRNAIDYQKSWRKNQMGLTVLNVTNRTTWEEHNGAELNDILTAFSYEKVFESGEQILDGHKFEIRLYVTHQEFKDGLSVPRYLALTTYYTPQTLSMIWYKVCKHVHDTAPVFENEKDEVPEYKQVLLKDVLNLGVAGNDPENNCDYVTFLLKLGDYYRDHEKELARAQIFNDIEELVNKPVRDINSTENEIARLRDQIRDLQAQMVNKASAISQLELDIITGKDKITTLASLKQMLINLSKKGVLNKIQLLTYSGTLISFTCLLEQPIKYWEDDEARNLYRYYKNKEYTNAFARNLFKLIFLKRKITMYTSCYLNMPVVQGYSPSNAEVNYQHEDFSYYNHKHISRFCCFGDNSSSIINAVIDKDYVTAFTCCMNAAMQYNMADSTVMKYVLHDLDYTGEYRRIKALEINGKMYSVAELHNNRTLVKELMEDDEYETY